MQCFGTGQGVATRFCHAALEPRNRACKSMVWAQPGLATRGATTGTSSCTCPVSVLA